MGLVFHFTYNLWRSLLAYSNGRFLHAASGVVLSCLLSLTFILGLYTTWFKTYVVLYFNSFSPLVLYLCVVVVTLSTFKVFLQVVTKFCKCFKIKLLNSQRDVQR
uniref:TLC domain-containing protein n=1 Tax=Schistosoma mansoni TaxID=6183 RepID=A0A5K4F9A9_SCHMA